MRGPRWAAAALLLASACATVPKAPVQKVECPHVFLFWPGGNHTGLLLPKRDFPVPEAFAGWPADVVTDWVDVGFGSDEYFQLLSNGMMMPRWRVLWRAPGAVMVRPFLWSGRPEDWHGPAIFRIDLPDAEYRKLLAYVAGSFARGKDDAPVLKTRLGPMAVYASTYDYSFRRICHTWVQDGLRASGVAGPRGWPYLQKQVQEGYASRYRKPDACR